jgi:hypothetical protein
MDTTEQLSERVVVMLSAAQKAEIHAGAKAANMGIGEYIRSLLFPDQNPMSLRSLYTQVQALTERVQVLEQRLTQKELPRD